MIARVSNIEAFRRWRLDEDATPADLVERLTSFQPSEPMLAGTAFHLCLELAQPGEYGVLTANGYTFLFPEDAVIGLPRIRELRLSKQYGPLTVSGQVDALEALRVEDHKTTGYFNSEGYWEGCQWKFYLDIFEADRFRWNVFPLKAVRGQEKTYEVDPPQILEQVRYPGLHNDCMALARDYHAFASKYLQPQELAA